MQILHHSWAWGYIYDTWIKLDVHKSQNHTEEFSSVKEDWLLPLNFFFHFDRLEIVYEPCPHRPRKTASMVANERSRSAQEEGRVMSNCRLTVILAMNSLLFFCVGLSFFRAQQLGYLVPKFEAFRLRGDISQHVQPSTGLND